MDITYVKKPTSFSKEFEAQVVKSLATKSALEVAVETGIIKFYNSKMAARNRIAKILDHVRSNPEAYREFGITQEVMDLVDQAIGSRRMVYRPAQTVIEISSQEEIKDEKDIKKMVLKIRNKTFSLIDRKLDRISKNKKALDDISFRELGIVAGIAFDKGQILKGEATENIAVHSKIDHSMDPEEALKLALSMREKTQESKEE